MAGTETTTNEVCTTVHCAHCISIARTEKRKFRNPHTHTYKKKTLTPSLPLLAALKEISFVSLARFVGSTQEKAAAPAAPGGTTKTSTAPAFVDVVSYMSREGLSSRGSSRTTPRMSTTLTTTTTTTTICLCLARDRHLETGCCSCSLRTTTTTTTKVDHGDDSITHYSTELRFL